MVDVDVPKAGVAVVVAPKLNDGDEDVVVVPKPPNTVAFVVITAADGAAVVDGVGATATVSGFAAASLPKAKALAVVAVVSSFGTDVPKVNPALLPVGAAAVVLPNEGKVFELVVVVAGLADMDAGGLNAPNPLLIPNLIPDGLVVAGACTPPAGAFVETAA